MCGIIGYIGKRKVIPLLLQGLKRMEYRGYDSSGIALIHDQKFQLYKQKGRIEELEKVLNGTAGDASVGIGHTRWATHGEPSVLNAHPHTSSNGKIALIHNGIIENYSELRKALAKKGYKFQSQTDTETLVHLIQEFYEGDLVNAVLRALRRLEGTYGIAVLHVDEPDRIVVARKGSPLVVGIGEGENFIASDLAAIVEYTRDVIFLEDGELGTVTTDNFHHFNLEESVIKRKVTHIDFNLDQIEKGGYKHFMLKEIMEQPQTLENTMRGRALDDIGEVRLGGLIRRLDELKDAERIMLLACGTSYHSGLVGEYMIEEWARIPVEVEYASEFRYRNPIIPPNTVAIAISQSGETADTLAALREAQARNALGLSIVNTVGSTIARESEGGIYLHAGHEIGVASTKAFTSQVTVLALFALLLAQQRDFPTDKIKEILGELRRIPSLVERILKKDREIFEIAKIFSRASNFLYLARGPNFPVALEGALKLKEISYIHAEGYPAAEMKHGPIALIDRMMPVVFIATRDKTYKKVIANIEEVRSRGGTIIAVVNEDDEEIMELSDYVIRIPSCHPMLMPILTAIPLQLLAYHIANLLGRDVDKPRNLAKSVTVE
ncbi:MAG: glutamine--fructose-6-phosphate transaminase (isomerizing) [Candidatus Electryonea clarkiae]|nr:glutamine--fructose-6-phosphate transaminase (isomerizing) [Candidatus Electryonea clarkiae]MDP8288326.1 glutamine--fructose-6-phosphate transaminase (isomerizing) [Candidatus Electryonea clarkiae]